MIAIDQTGARQSRARPARVSSGWLIAGGAVALLLLGALAARGLAPRAGRAQGGSPSAASAAKGIDPRLILQPRTLTQVATAGGLRLSLTVGPLMPGPNRFELRLAARRRPAVAAHVYVAAIMTGMAMRPVTLSMREAQPGHYVGMGPLTMFGRWQLTIRIDRPGAAPLTHRFSVGVDLPPGLLVAQGARGGSHR